MPDLHTLTAYDLLTYLADANFKDTALLHDALVSKACAYMDAEQKSIDGFNRYSRMQAVARAAMVLQWPDAASAWLGE